MLPGWENSERSLAGLRVVLDDCFHPSSTTSVIYVCNGGLLGTSDVLGGIQHTLVGLPVRALAAAIPYRNAVHQYALNGVAIEALWYLSK